MRDKVGGTIQSLLGSNAGWTSFLSPLFFLGAALIEPGSLPKNELLRQKERTTKSYNQPHYKKIVTSDKMKTRIKMCLNAKCNYQILFNYLYKH